MLFTREPNEPNPPSISVFIVKHILFCNDETAAREDCLTA